MKSLEDKAQEVGDNAKSLLHRLKEARSCLASDGFEIMKEYAFDFQNKRLVSKDGCYALEWRLRQHPDEPISYENQQTNCGTVVFVQIHKRGQDLVRDLTNSDKAEEWWKGQGKEVPPRDPWSNEIDINSPWQKMYRAWLKWKEKHDA